MPEAYPLDGMVVIDLSSGVAGGYCTKHLADGGAEVIKLEPPEGDRLRRWAIGGVVAPTESGPLFEFVGGGKKSLVIDPEDRGDTERARALVARADVVVWTRGSRLADSVELSPASLRDLAPRAIVAAITPFGLDGPWSDRPASDLTLQAWGGAIFGRGEPGRAPVQVGGRPGEWLAGLFAAVGVLSAWQRVTTTGTGELLDVSILETLVLTQQTYAVTRQSMVPPERTPLPERFPTRAILLPAIYKTTDGWVGFLVATARMWEAFCVMVDHPEWIDDERLYAYAGRLLRGPEIEAATRDWCARRSSDEVLERAELLRIPAAPVGTGPTVTGIDHFVERKLYVRNPRSGHLQPDVAYTIRSGPGRRPVAPAPRLGEHRPEDVAQPAAAATPNEDGPARPLPFEGLRVADFTAFWAGSIVGHHLAMLGAEVIHVESVKRPDGIRGHSVRSTEDEQWWEWTPLFHGPNTNKLGITLDMNDERGKELAERLIACSDVMLENYAPRVMQHWGLTEDRIRELRPDLVYVRMPAFGLSGPWRERTGYAQCMEMSSGLAWLTGYPDDRPQVPNGMGDPLAGLHAMVGLLLALEQRRRSGQGTVVESPMVGGALNIAAELPLEFQAYGYEMCRDGNRGPTAAPQNLYRTADQEQDGRLDYWIALAVETDDQWASLRKALGDPSWAAPEALATAAGRRAAHDALDRHLAAWCAPRSADEIVETLWPAGVPVGKVLAPVETKHVAQLVARGFFETVRHPLTGDQLHLGWPVRFSAGPRHLHRRPTPMLGQHNREILIDLLGVTPERFAELEADDVVGTELLGQHRTR
jgi:crotonobetainyl-CoA:carnitine CoA-transferase CaiB-like acyl-CoA transferase